MKENKYIWQKAMKKPIVVKFREVNGKEQIETREGVLTANQEEDYIIQGIDGEIYPIKKSIFYHTYDVIEEDMNGHELKHLELDFGEILKIIKAEFGDYRKAYEIEKYIKQYIRAACNFYLKYKDKPKLLGWDYPLFIDRINEIHKKRIEAEEALGPNYKPSNTFIDEYNEWLFKEAFKSVLRGGGNE